MSNNHKFRIVLQKKIMNLATHIPSENDKFNLSNEDIDYKDLITRLKEIKSTISLLEKIIFK